MYMSTVDCVTYQFILDVLLSSFLTDEIDYLDNLYTPGFNEYSK